MAIEAAGTISGLNKSWPLFDDFLNEGDDHIRLIKSVLQSQFPGAAGNGFNQTITATEDELNNLALLYDQLMAPKNTRILFSQASAPNGWAIVTGSYDHMLRVVDANGGDLGGMQSPITSHSHNIAAHAHTTQGHALTWDEMPAHSHGAQCGLSNALWYPEDGRQLGFYGGTPDDYIIHYETSVAGNGNAHYHGNTGATALVTSTEYTPKYMNVILCEKL